MANPQNVIGHQARLDFLKRTLPPEKVGFAYVGGGDRIDPAIVGFMEEEALRRHHSLDNAYVIDLGCGVGRLTTYLLDSPVRRYLGTDILPEILGIAAQHAKGRPEFTFTIARDCTIPADDDVADIVCGFSLITHLLDEEAFLYLRETSRVLKSEGVAVFSFLDFALPSSQPTFDRYVSAYKAQRDLLKFFEKDTLTRFGRQVGLDTIEIIDAHTPFTITGSRKQMPNGQPCPQQAKMGQSLIFFRRKQR